MLTKIVICTLFAIFYCQVSTIATSLNPFGMRTFGLDGKIINGTLATQNLTKHQVSVRRKLNDGYFFGTGHICGGSLISEKVVLSAAHCYVDYNNAEIKGTFLPPDDFIVVAGNLDRFLQNNDTLVFGVEKIIFAVELFDLTTYYQDIALLILNGSVPVNHTTVEPIRINRKRVTPGTMCQVTGWGQTETEYLSDYLMTVDVPIIDNNVCANDTQFWEDAIRPGMLCAGYLQGEKDACSGDSGGPLVCNVTQAGIVSWGVGCAMPELPGVYTDVSYYSKWIDEQLKLENITIPGYGEYDDDDDKNDDKDDGSVSFKASIILTATLLISIIATNKIF